MARIVLTTWGSYGDINPYMGLALALKARGHEPVLAAPDYYRGLAEGEGVAFHAGNRSGKVGDRGQGHASSARP
jgi:rhamnosyltransferase subunit B